MRKVIWVIITSMFLSLSVYIVFVNLGEYRNTKIDPNTKMNELVNFCDSNVSEILITTDDMDIQKDYVCLIRNKNIINEFISCVKHGRNIVPKSSFRQYKRRYIVMIKSGEHRFVIRVMGRKFDNSMDHVVILFWKKNDINMLQEFISYKKYDKQFDSYFWTKYKGINSPEYINYQLQNFIQKYIDRLVDSDIECAFFDSNSKNYRIISKDQFSLY